MSISPPSHSGRSQWVLALGQLTEALRLLDESKAPPEIGAELDLAIHRLENAIRGAGIPSQPPPRLED